MTKDKETHERFKKGGHGIQDSMTQKQGVWFI